DDALMLRVSVKHCGRRVERIRVEGERLAICQRPEPFWEDPNDIVAAMAELTGHGKEWRHVAQVHDRGHGDAPHAGDARAPRPSAQLTPRKRGSVARGPTGPTFCESRSTRGASVRLCPRRRCRR